ncbi:hypothetical protein Tco_0277815 [Tanacetum coccineum]
MMIPKDEVNESPNLDHQDDPSIPRPPPEPPDIEKCFKPEAGILITKEFKGVSKPHDFMADILLTLPTLVQFHFISLFSSSGVKTTIIDPAISTLDRWPLIWMELSRFHPTISEAFRVELYRYIKNHKKTVKNGQARTRERKSVQKPEAKP